MRVVLPAFLASCGAPVISAAPPAEVATASQAPAVPVCDGPSFTAEALGFSLNQVPSTVPADAEGLRAFLSLREPAPVDIVLVAGPAIASPWTFDFAGVAGGATCSIAPQHVSVGGLPPHLIVHRPHPLALERVLRAEVALASEHAPEARSELGAALAVDPLWRVPESLAGLSYGREGRWPESVLALREIVVASPWRPGAHADLGAVLFAARERVWGTTVLVTALALACGAERERRLLEDLSDGVDVHFPTLPPAWRRPGEAAAWVAPVPPVPWRSLVLAEARAYASCKEAFRRSTTLRRDAAGLESPRWLWSVGEEDVCTLLWLDAYDAHVRTRARPRDPRLDELQTIAKAGLIGARSIYDVGGRAHPLAAMLLPATRRDRLVHFVSRYRVTRMDRGGWLPP